MRFKITAMSVMPDVGVGLIMLVRQFKKSCLAFSVLKMTKYLFLSFLEISLGKKRSTACEKYDSVFIKLCFINSNNAVNRCFSDYLK